jgi:hypothetical protein
VGAATQKRRLCCGPPKTQRTFDALPLKRNEFHGVVAFVEQLELIVVKNRNGSGDQLCNPLNEAKLFSEWEGVYWALVFVASQKGECG